MRKIQIIGIGAGNPEYVTIQAINALNRVDVFFIPDKGTEKAELRALRQDIIDRFIRAPGHRTVAYQVPKRESDPHYEGTVDRWHEALAESYERLFLEHLREGQCGGLLVWGDPSLYDSTLRIIERVEARGVALEVEVIPGISAVQALAARHRIALNRIGKPGLVTTGRRLAEGLSPDVDDAVVMLDGELSVRKIDAVDLDIYWGAYLGTPDEILLSGPVSEVLDEIERTRAEARARKGWIMDTYLLRRRE